MIARFFAVPLVRIILGLALVGLLVFAVFTWWPIPQIRAFDWTQAPPAAKVEAPAAPVAAKVEAPAAPAAAKVEAPAASAISGDIVTVKDTNGVALATIKFVTKVDNMPTEWLKDRMGIFYLYQSGIGNQVELKITLFEGGAFAMDGDWASVDGQDLGKVNDPADFLLFADQPGTYKVTVSSFGLAVGIYRSTDDKAGFVLADRKNATNDDRPVYWLDPDGTVTELK